MSDYKIGYKRPPKQTQFKKGQSGNPKGRPKAAKNVVTDIKEELEEVVQITEAGQVKTVTKQRALIKSLLAKAGKGDVRAAQTLLGLKAEVDHREHEKESEEWFTDDDLEIIAQVEHRLKSTRGHSDNGGIDESE